MLNILEEVRLNILCTNVIGNAKAITKLTFGLTVWYDTNEVYRIQS